MTKLEKIRNIIEGLPEGYELYAAVGALVSIADVLDQEDEDAAKELLT